MMKKNRLLEISLFLMMLSNSLPAHAITTKTKALLCPMGSSNEYNAEYVGSVILNKQFLDSKLPLEESAKQAAKEQLKYFTGYYLNSEQEKKSNVLLRSSESPTIIILSASTVSYGKDIQIDWDQASAAESDNVYVQNAARRSFTKREDAAYLFRYRVNLTVSRCANDSSPIDYKMFPVPRDPFLFYWFVSSGERRHLQWGSVRTLTNPCANNEFADYPHPLYFWYFWEPTRADRDANGQVFDCKVMLTPNIDYTFVKLELKSARTVTNDFSRLKREFSAKPVLNASIIFGYLDHHREEPNLREVLVEVKALLSTLVNRLQAPARMARFESSTENLFVFLKGLIATMTLRKADAFVENNYLHILIESSLNQSQKPMNLHIVLGRTDVFAETTPGHWSYILDALSKSDLILYSGHSGLGENFNLNNAAQALNLPASALTQRLQRAPYQLISYFSCISYTYFGRDLAELTNQARGSRAKGQDFIYTGFPVMFPDMPRLALLPFDLVDRLLSAQGHTIPIGSSRYFRNTDYLIFKSME